MAEHHKIDLELPVEADLSAGEEEILKTLCEVIVGLRHENRRRWEEVRQHLVGGGWTVRCELAWHAEARRGRELEEACGRTREEAIEKLHRVTCAESLEGCP